MDWYEIGTRVLEAVLPLLAVSVTGLVLSLINKTWAEIRAARPQLADQIDEAAHWVIPVVEQLKKNGTLPDNQAAKAYAVDAVSKYLVAIGFAGDIARVERVISDSIEGALGKANEFRLIVKE